MIPKSVQRLIEDFQKLPGIGAKSAQRLAFYLMYVPEEQVRRFAADLASIKTDVTICSECKNVTENNPCDVCTNNTRDRKTLAVVANPLDALAMDKAGYRGIYQVLHGVIDPLNGVGPDELFIEHLLKRLEHMLAQEKDLEILLATGASLEGEATALYISKRVKSKFGEDVKISRLAKGLPVGGDVEFADEVTLSRAIEGRQPL